MFAIGCLENLSYPSVADLDIILRIAPILNIFTVPEFYSRPCVSFQNTFGS